MVHLIYSILVTLEHLFRVLRDIGVCLELFLEGSGNVCTWGGGGLKHFCCFVDPTLGAHVPLVLLGYV